MQAASLYRAMMKYSGEVVGECGGTTEGADGASDGLAVIAVGNAMGEVGGIAEGASDGLAVIAVGNAMGEVGGIAEGASDGKEVIVLATV